MKNLDEERSSSLEVDYHPSHKTASAKDIISPHPPSLEKEITSNQHTPQSDELGKGNAPQVNFTSLLQVMKSNDKDAKPIDMENLHQPLNLIEDQQVPSQHVQFLPQASPSFLQHELAHTLKR